MAMNMNEPEIIYETFLLLRKDKYKDRDKDKYDEVVWWKVIYNIFLIISFI